jgi:hypothetical protein
MDYLGKHALRGHNARAYLPEDRTFGMTFFAELGKLKDGLISYREMSANGQGEQVYSLSCQILGKIPGANVETKASHLLDAFNGQKAYLAMRRGTRMGIADEAKILFSGALDHRFFPDTFPIAGTYSDYVCHC